jgi:transcriptional regulator with XRE-family HTH domain
MLEEDIEIGNKIRQFRVMKHYSQEQLSKVVELNKQSISRIENGLRRVSHSELSKIAEFLGEPVEVFTEREVKNKLIQLEKAYTAIPKFAVDFLNDYKLFFGQKEMTAPAAKAIANEIKDRMSSIYIKRFRASERLP